ncbi:MAG TPA: histidine kinase [Chitinophagaceae bacterium]|nr:histidine kinase [Chitinophagaceae bacterium]
MQWVEFVFSEKRGIRLLRHSLFWVLWWLYITLTFYWQYDRWLARGGEKPFFVLLGSHLFLKTFLLTAVYALVCYVFIYYLMPGVIKGKWVNAISSGLIVCGFLFVAGYYLYWNIFPFVDSLFGPFKPNHYISRFWPAVWLGFIEPFKIFAAAAVIKYVKYWWMRQKDKERLEREKLNTELQLLRAQIRPGFLFNALDNIHANALKHSPFAPDLLIKLSDLLSYMLYECDKPRVPLDKEIAMMKKYMEMEKIRQGEWFEMGIEIQGDFNGKMIAPFILFPFIENSFKQSNALNGNAWIIMEIGMEENLFFMKLANGLLPGTNDKAEEATNGLNNVKKRLALIYPRHQLNLYSEQEMLITRLKIQLDDRTPTEEIENEELAIEESH